MRLSMPIGAPGLPGPNNRLFVGDQGAYTLSGQANSFTYVSGTSAITHGSQLIAQGSTGCNVGPTVLLGTFGYPGNLPTVAIPARGYLRADAPEEFAPTGTYVYNNNLANKGGIVPAGGMIIDGYSIPAGTYVVQFKHFSGGIYCAPGSPSFLFRGCRFRGNVDAPAWLNCNVDYTGSMKVFYCDIGGLGSTDADGNIAGMIIQAGSSFIAYRNYSSLTPLGYQINVTSGGEVTECLVEHVIYYYGGTGPPSGPQDAYHLNGINCNGGQTCQLWQRNKIIFETPDLNGRAITQTGCIELFQDFGQYPGTGTNRDGSVGYQIKDNYLAGAGFCIYAGQNAGTAAATVNNVVVTGNQISTSAYLTGGFFGPITAEPAWNTRGNVKSNNTWADGPNVGQSAF